MKICLVVTKLLPFYLTLKVLGQSISNFNMTKLIHAQILNEDLSISILFDY